MARGTRGPKPEEGSRDVHATSRQRLPLAAEALLMAGLAGQPGVPTLEPVPGLTVVEGLSPHLPPPDQVVLETLMLDVTRLAVAVVRPGMQTFSTRDPFPERRVTGEALRRSRSAPRLMALQALRAPLQRRMSLAELPGGDLAGCQRSGQGDDAGERELGAGAAHQRPPHAYPVMIATATCTTRNRYMTMAKGLCTTCQ
jgi:hypothetical protein